MKNVTHNVFGLAILLGSIAFVTPALAQEEPQAGSFAQLLKCRPLTDIAKKAACYDAAMDSIQKGAQGGKVSIVTETQINNLERDAFGFNLPSLPKLRLGRPHTSPGKNTLSSAQTDKDSKILKKGKSGEVLRVAYMVSRVSTLPNGHKKIYLNNGQVWEQVGSDAPRFRGSPPYSVRIKKAALGSYLLTVAGSKRTVRVRRIK